MYEYIMDAYYGDNATFGEILSHVSWYGNERQRELIRDDTMLPEELIAAILEAE